MIMCLFDTWGVTELGGGEGVYVPATLDGVWTAQ